MAEIIDGRRMAEDIRGGIKKEIDAVRETSGRTPKLVSIMAGIDKDAELYVSAQGKTAKSVGIDFVSFCFKDDVTQDELINKIDELNSDASVTAIIVQHPLPSGIDHDKVVSVIRPEKDAEGIHPYNLGRLFRKDADLVPCTPGAVMKILNLKGVDLYGKDVVIIGRSAIVGKPLSLMMLNESATTTVCHTGTYKKGDITGYTGKADILVVAMGKPGIVKADWVKEGAVVIDVGINNVSGRIVGDVDFDDVSKKASLITPVPGGVGPVTVSILMRNVLRSYRLQYGKI
jgi:methylenetetrahydrofolate dehydrogenase (NADP+)/methenyltetrahydrofolate cyclohydrolase